MSCLPKIKQANGVREALALTHHAVRGVEQELQVQDVAVDDCAHQGRALVGRPCRNAASRPSLPIDTSPRASDNPSTAAASPCRLRPTFHVGPLHTRARTHTHTN
jgi:hypothetical protein